MAIRRFSIAEPGVKSNRFWDQDTAQGAVVPIATHTLSSPAGTFSFTNIPQTFQDLMIVATSREIVAAGNFSSFYLSSNLSTGNVYSQTLLYGDGASALSSRATAKSYADLLGYMPGTSSTTGVFGSAIFHFLNYANTSTFKTYLGRTVSDVNGSGYTTLGANLIANTGAITSINLSGTNNLAAGSSATLYGIKAGA